jgi:HEAT repeat protein
VKVPDLVRALFPQIVVHLDSSAANQYLKQLLVDPNVDVRVEAILSAAKLGRDDFLPQIRNLASQAHFAQQEACAIALGELKDTRGLPILKALAVNGRKEVELAALISLCALGEQKALKPIEKMARSGNLFALAALGNLKEGKEILQEMIFHADRDVRLNAILSLLQQGVSCPIEEILIPGTKDFGFMRLSSPGHGLQAWKSIPSHRQNTKRYPGLIQQTMGLREKSLAQCIELPEPRFFEIARRIISENQTELIPLLVVLLENKRNEESLALLKEGQQKAGEPLIRNYCTLALYRLHEEGPYEERLINWSKSAGDKVLIEFREDDSEPSLSTRHELTPEEASRFFVETFETLAQAQNQTGVEALVHAMAYGNPKNRYALAGLLIRTTE